MWIILVILVLARCIEERAMRLKGVIMHVNC